MNKIIYSNIIYSKVIYSRIIYSFLLLLSFVVTTKAQDSMYVFKNGILVSKRAVLDVDSVIFYKPTNILYAPGNGVTDREGNFYPTIIIGGQEWMQENLRVTTFNDGSAIPLVTNGTSWSGLSTPGMCWYNNDQATYTANKYGALYNWFTANAGNVCPVGWHVPTDAEQTTLDNYLGGVAVAGGKLKEKGLVHWSPPNGSASNSSGFTSLPNGYRDGATGSFSNVATNGYWWTSTQLDATGAHYRYTHYSYPNLYHFTNYKTSGYAIRCLKN